MADDEVLEAVGGERGGAERPSGELVVVRLDGPVLDVFHETGCERFHAAFVDTIELAEHPSYTGTGLKVEGARRGISIPVRFEGEQRERLERIIERVRELYRAGS